MAQTRYIVIDRVGQRGTISILGARKKWEQDPDFVFLPSLRIAGLQPDLETYMRERGMPAAKVRDTLSEAITSQTAMEEAFKEMLVLEERATHRDAFLELVSVKSVRLVYPKSSEKAVTVAQKKAILSAARGKRAGTAQRVAARAPPREQVILQAHQRGREAEVARSEQQEQTSDDQVALPTVANGVKKESVRQMEAAVTPKQRRRLGSVKTRLLSVSKKPKVSRYGTLDYILE